MVINGEKKFYVYLGFTTKSLSQSKEMLRARKKKIKILLKKERSVRERALRMRGSSQRGNFPHTVYFFLLLKKKTAAGMNSRFEGLRRKKKTQQRASRYERGQIE